MGVAQAVEVNNDAYSVDDAMDVLFSKLDDAIDDLENARVVTEEELWKELDSI